MGPGSRRRSDRQAPIRVYLDWVHDKAANDGGSNAGQTANKARETLRALLSWASEQDYVEKLPRFPKSVFAEPVLAARFRLDQGDDNEHEIQQQSQSTTVACTLEQS
jgi:hypothetical protein